MNDDVLIRSLILLTSSLIVAILVFGIIVIIHGIFSDNQIKSRGNIMEEILTCKCGNQEFKVHENFAMCSKCKSLIRHMLVSGWFPKDPAIVLISLDIENMNTLENVTG